MVVLRMVAASAPFNRGIARSNTIKSGFNFLACSMASIPSAASPHTSNPACSKKIRITSRTESPSSITNILCLRTESVTADGIPSAFCCCAINHNCMAFVHSKTYGKRFSPQGQPYFTLYFGFASSLRRAPTNKAISATRNPAPTIPAKLLSRAGRRDGREISAMRSHHTSCTTIFMHYNFCRAHQTSPITPAII